MEWNEKNYLRSISVSLRNKERLLIEVQRKHARYLLLQIQQTQTAWHYGKMLPVFLEKTSQHSLGLIIIEL